MNKEEDGKKEGDLKIQELMALGDEGHKYATDVIKNLNKRQESSYKANQDLMDFLIKSLFLICWGSITTIFLVCRLSPDGLTQTIKILFYFSASTYALSILSAFFWIFFNITFAFHRQSSKTIIGQQFINNELSYSECLQELDEDLKSQEKIKPTRLFFSTAILFFLAGFILFFIALILTLNNW